MESDSKYFSKRAAQEKLAAQSATHSVSRRAHLQLAARYEDLASAITAREYFIGLDLYFDGPALRA